MLKMFLPEGRRQTMQDLLSLTERIVAELIGQIQSGSVSISTNLWAAVRSRGCDFQLKNLNDGFKLNLCLFRCQFLGPGTSFATALCIWLRRNLIFLAMQEDVLKLTCNILSKVSCFLYTNFHLYVLYVKNFDRTFTINVLLLIFKL